MATSVHIAKLFLLLCKSLLLLSMQGLTQFEASKAGVCTARLPIHEHAVTMTLPRGHLNLSINQGAA